MGSENCCDDVCFSELVRCYEEGGYKKAHGWTAFIVSSVTYTLKLFLEEQWH